METLTPDVIDHVDQLPKDIPIETIIELKTKHDPPLSDTQIANLLNCSKQNINQRLKDYRDDIQGLPAFKKNRADILALTQSRIINSLTNKDIQKTPAVQRATMFGIFYDKERLERGQATEITANFDVAADLNTLIEQIKSVK